MKFPFALALCAFAALAHGGAPARCRYAGAETVVVTTRDPGDTRTLTLRLASGGGYATTLSLKP
ncbi:MAG: hypothetical protein ABI162_16925 [Luteolibacter sp.]